MAFTQWAAGMKITADRLRGITPKFQNWTPHWTTSTGSALPGYGNATISCRWAKSGDLVIAKFNITFGSTTNFGGGSASDNYRFSLPYAAATAGDSLGVLVWCGGTASAVPMDARAGTVTYAELWTGGGWPYHDITAPVEPAQLNGVMDAISPRVWANGDSLRGVLMYEGA